MSERTPTVGENIRRIRIQRGITQRDLASLIGKSYSSIQKYEMDLATPPLTVVKKLAEVLDVDKYEIYGWNEFDLESTEIEKSPAPNSAELTDPNEDHLISNYRSLDSQKQSSLIDYSDFLKKQMSEEG